VLKYVVAHFGENRCQILATDGIERFYLSAITSFYLSHVTEEYLTFVMTWMPWLFLLAISLWHGRGHCEFFGSIL
jgi:hypothetical protein